MSNFYRWFADESAKLAQYMRAKKRAESRETVRKTYRELAGAYAILCLADGFGLVIDNPQIGFMLCKLDKEDRHGF